MHPMNVNTLQLIRWWQITKNIDFRFYFAQTWFGHPNSNGISFRLRMPCNPPPSLSKMAGIKNYTKKSAGEGQKILSLSNYHPGDSEILNWCSARSVLGEGESPSLVMAGHPSSDGVTITISYGVDVLLHQPASSYPRPAFLIGLSKTEFNFIVRSVETGLRR